MNRVGSEGKGESVWLAWFLIETLEVFSRSAKPAWTALKQRRIVARRAVD